MTLTPRERSILALTWAELSIKEQAERLGVHVSTVKFHRAHLLRKMEAQTLVGLLKKALQLGLISYEQTGVIGLRRSRSSL